MEIKNKDIKAEETNQKSRPSKVSYGIVKNAVFWIIGLAILWFVVNYILD